MNLYRDQMYDERVVAMSLVFDPANASTALAKLTPDDFVDQHARAIFEITQSIRSDGAPSGELAEYVARGRNHPQLLQFKNGLTEVYAKWHNELVAPVRRTNFGSFCQRVKEAAHHRHLEMVAAEMQAAISAGDLERMSQLKNELVALEVVTEDPPASIVDTMQKIDDQISGADLSAVRRIPTGMADLDTVLNGGLASEQLIVLAASTGVGKSASGQIAMQAGAENFRVLIVTIEMSAHELYSRMLSSLTGISSAFLEHPERMTDVQRSRIAEASNRLTNIAIQDRPPFTIDAIRSQCEKAKPDLLIVDYIQLMDVNRRLENRQLQVAENTRELKLLAKELRIPIIGVAQLNRAADGILPKLSHLRESGELENSANTVIFIWRADTKETHGRAQLIVAKNRSGRVGTVDCVWNGDQLRFDLGSFRKESEASPHQAEFDDWNRGQI